MRPTQTSTSLSQRLGCFVGKFPRLTLCWPGFPKGPPKLPSLLHNSKGQPPLYLASGDLDILNTRTQPSSLLLVYYCEVSLSSWHLRPEGCGNPRRAVTMASFPASAGFCAPSPSHISSGEGLFTAIFLAPLWLCLSLPAWHRIVRNIFMALIFLFWNSNRKSRTKSYRTLLEEGERRMITWP